MDKCARKQSSTSYPIPLFMVDETDLKTPETGLSPTVNISKNGGAFAAASGAVSEIGGGWYSLAGNATDRNTLGELIIEATATGAAPFRAVYSVVPYDPFEVVDANVTKWNGTAVATPDTAGYPKVTLKVGTGTGEVNLASGKAPATIAAGDIANNAITAAAIATDAIDSDAIAASAVTEIQSGLATATDVSDSETTLTNLINAINQSASRRIVLSVSAALERPESSSIDYFVELRTYDGDGAAVNADSTPTITVRDISENDLSAGLSAVSNITTGVYRATYSVASSDSTGQIRFDASATISASVFTISALSVVTDLEAGQWSVTDITDVMNMVDQFLTMTQSIGGGAYGLSSGILTQIQTSADTACQAVIVANHLDHLLAAAYDPASKPGHAEALLNELVENDAGVSRFTANALEQGPATSVSSIFNTADTIETGLTFKNAMRLVTAAAASKLSGANTTTVTLRDWTDSTNLIVATVDAYGNRTAVTYNL